MEIIVIVKIIIITRVRALNVYVRIMYAYCAEVIFGGAVTSA